MSSGASLYVTTRQEKSWRRTCYMFEAWQLTKGAMVVRSRA